MQILGHIIKYTLFIHMYICSVTYGFLQLNKIPILQEMLGSKDQVCKTLQPFSHVPGLFVHYFS